MNPSIDVRLATMIRAMTDVIMPALDEAPGLASEQAQLVLGHLHVLREQVVYAGRFEELEYRAAVSMGEAFVAATRGDATTSPASRRLEAALATDAGGRPEDTRDLAEAIRASVEELVRIDTKNQARLRSILLEHERTAADLNRSWFAGMGWESGDTGLPSIPELINDGISVPERKARS